MKRRALIIGVPGDGIHNKKLAGVDVDLINYHRFLASPLGGTWGDNEIQILRNPTPKELQEELEVLREVDYAFVTFSGHGGHNTNTRSTHLELGPNVSFDSRFLKIGSRRQTVVLDCCRDIYEPPISELSVILESLASLATELDPEACRRAFDDHVNRCVPATIMLHACSIDEGADDQAAFGGLYSSSLIDVAEGIVLDARIPRTILDVPSAHAQAAIKVQIESDKRQNPTIDLPRVSTYFPFAVTA